ncbi:MAG: HDOD domain-containing protein [Gammaproteobacteria bacterium]|nr:MAG: HDOD domain-containing protein [Gammaproteobacteria bacterium]
MPETSSLFYLGRQPIFNRDLETVAYELLFRAGFGNRADVQDGDQATARIIEQICLESDLAAIVEDKQAFINVTRPFILGEYPLPLKPGQVVLEVLEDITLDESLLEALKALRKKGYRIALDDFLWQEGVEPFIELAEFVKLDILSLSKDALEDYVQRLKPFDVKLLAEKVETWEQWEDCRERGFDYFQGYFMGKPRVLSGARLPQNRLTLLRLLSYIQRPDASVKEIEKLISSDVALSFRLLKVVNSAFYSFPTRVESVRRAVVLLGFDAIRRWATLIVLSAYNDNPPELLRLSLIRARMCESIAEEMGEGRIKDSYFTMGLFSLLDALLDQPMERIIASLPLVEAINEALLHRAGRMGMVLRWVEAYERGDIAEIAAAFDLQKMRRIWEKAVSWESAISRELAIS